MKNRPPSVISLAFALSLAGLVSSVCDSGWAEYLGNCYFFQNFLSASSGQKPASVGVGTPTCPNGWTMNGNKCYLMDLTRPSGSWSDCGNYCAANSGSMLCIEDSIQENYILDHMGALPSVWLSYNDRAVEGNWRWAAGCQNNGYTHWDSLYHEPNGGYTENCAELYARNAQGRGWNDAKCDGLDVNWPKYCFCQAGATYTGGGGGGGGVTETPVPSVEPTRRPTRQPTSVAPPTDTLCEMDWIGYHGVCYLLGNSGAVTESAAACSDHCTSQRGNMLCIEDADTEMFVLQNEYHDDHDGYSSTSYGAWLDYGYSVYDGAFTWGAGCTNTGYTNWAPGEPQGASDGCTMFNFATANWEDTPCMATEPLSCYCSSTSTVITDDTPHDDTATEPPAASGSDGASSGNSSVGWIIAAVVAGVAVLGGGVALLAWCYTNARAAPTAAPSVYAAVPPPSPYVPVQQQPAYDARGTPHYPSYTGATAPVYGNAGGSVPNYYAGGSIAMVPLPVQISAHVPVSDSSAMGAKYSGVVPSAPSTPSAPPMQAVGAPAIATATAVPYEYAGGGYNNTQIVMAEVVMDSSHV